MLVEHEILKKLGGGETTKQDTLLRLSYVGANNVGRYHKAFRISLSDTKDRIVQCLDFNLGFFSRFNSA